jgi:antitoxin ParD1/3/4
MPTRNVVITARQAEMIDRLVSDGLYQNASEVLREGLRLIEETQRTREAKLEALRAAIQLGDDALERGDFVSFDDAPSLRAHIRELGRKARAR